MIKFGTLLFLILLQSSVVQATQSECAILLHGMGRTHFSMGLIKDVLKEQGYHVWSESYPSLTKSVDELTVPTIESGLTYCKNVNAKKIHFITHSLGGIVVRHYLQDHQIPNLGRIVMLAPPNKGSEIADQMKDGFFYRSIMGPAGQVLGTDDKSLPNRLKPIRGEIGIIAGEKEGSSWFLPEIPGEDDGKVAVERTKLAEMKDFLKVKSGHTFIMRDDEVISQVIFFLQNGKFKRNGDSAAE
ncbi:MAG: hypothetical protein KZQ80_13305 [Candidatus Thiodiazotropha sp. (ex Monitilora ramsayi)]|nr:hypothetical protein [Candidatus Thiodiazotropha sp. (ex Monitilora ramsayi)]